MKLRFEVNERVDNHYVVTVKINDTGVGVLTMETQDLDHLVKVIRLGVAAEKAADEAARLEAEQAKTLPLPDDNKQQVEY